MTATDTGFTSTVASLKAKADNLRPDDKERALGIIASVETYGSLSPRQRNEILRLERMATKKWRNTYKPRPSWSDIEARPGETPADLYRRSVNLIASTRFFFNGHETAQQQERSARAAVTARYERAIMGDEAYKVEQKRLYEVRTAHTQRQEVSRAKRQIRDIVEHYERAKWLRYALPTIDLPHLKHRRDLIACLSRRLQYVRRGGPRTCGTYSDWETAIIRIRACLIAEGRAELIARKYRNMPLEAAQ